MFNKEFKMNIDEIEKYIIGKKIKDMSLEEIRNFIEAQGNTIILNHHIYEKNQKEIERLNNIIKEVREYHDNCINNSLDLDKIDDNEKLAYKVAYGIHKRYLEILDKGGK